MFETQTLTLAEIEDLSLRALMAAGASEENSRPLAVAMAATEADGVASHGLAYIPIYCEHVQCGKVIQPQTPTLASKVRWRHRAVTCPHIFYLHPGLWQ